MVADSCTPHEIRICYTGVSLDSVGEGTETGKSLISIVWVVAHCTKLEQQILHAVPVLFGWYTDWTSCSWYSIHTFRTIP